MYIHIWYIEQLLKHRGSFHLKQPKVDCVPFDKFQNQRERIFEFETFSILTRTKKHFFFRRHLVLAICHASSWFHIAKRDFEAYITPLVWPIFSLIDQVLSLIYNVGRIDYLKPYKQSNTLQTKIWNYFMDKHSCQWGPNKGISTLLAPSFWIFGS